MHAKRKAVILLRSLGHSATLLVLLFFSTRQSFCQGIDPYGWGVAVAGATLPPGSDPGRSMSMATYGNSRSLPGIGNLGWAATGGNELLGGFLNAGENYFSSQVRGTGYDLGVNLLAQAFGGVDPNKRYGDVNAQGEVFYRDTILLDFTNATIKPQRFDRLSFGTTITGTLSTSVDSDPKAYADARVNYQITTPNFAGGVFVYSESKEVSAPGNGFAVFPEPVSIAPQAALFATANPNVYVTWISQDLSSFADVTYGSDSPATAASCNFWDTAKLTSVTFPDGNTPESYGVAVSVGSGLPSPNVAVPEPSTLALLGVAALGLLSYAWRQRKAA